MANKPDNASTFRITAGLTALMLIAAAALVYVQGTRSSGNGGNAPALQVVAHAQRLPLLAGAALRGDASAIDRLQESASELARRRQTPGLGAAGDFDALQQAADQFLASRNVLEAMDGALRGVEANSAQLVDGAERLLDVSGAATALQDFQARASGLGAAIAALPLQADREAAARSIDADLSYLRQVVDALSGAASELDIAALSADDQTSVLEPVGGALRAIEAAAAPLLADMQPIAEAQASLGLMQGAAQRIYDAAPSATGAARSQGLLDNPLLPLGLLGLGLLLILFLARLYSKSGTFEQEARAHAAQNERNQQAILRLLDELGSLADGDLTVEATVTEDITGAIADSINYAIEKLRELVATINETSIMVDSAAKQTESTAGHMARAADNQSREISAATESIVSMAASIEEVSGNAERSSDVARHSVEVAHKGGEAVRRTIDGMNTIRETIQDTSKRIKRLGESSQEIGNIVELINDIAEQTNILALNASIQASMAGEAGRGFAVVADEVQRLAERSTNATKQIEVLVRTIQADTNEAVVSMERSTTDVVGGALLAENAGAALDEIEQVSNQIANLVQNISGSARQQAGSAADVTRRTTKLKEIGEQTGKATTATAAAISKLSVLASQLRNTVSGFTLPSAALRSSALAAVPSAEPPPPEPIEEKAAG